MLAGRRVRVVPALFSVGVNEMATIASSIGDTTLEDEINSYGHRVLQQYMSGFMAWEANDVFGADVEIKVAGDATTTPNPLQAYADESCVFTPINATQVSENHTNRLSVKLEDDDGKAISFMKEDQAQELLEPPAIGLVEEQTIKGLRAARIARKERWMQDQELDVLVKEMTQLGMLVRQEDSYKEVRLLTVSASAARRMNGASWISCKSGKDRTGMLCTLEALNTFKEDQTVPSSVADAEVLSMLRARGVRIQNCTLNAGKQHFAFNRFQVAALPDELKPPMEAIGAAAS